VYLSEEEVRYTDWKNKCAFSEELKRFREHSIMNPGCPAAAEILTALGFLATVPS